MKYIPGQGYVQDGGVGKYNNPVLVALWEGNALWGTKPGLTVSLGAGYYAKDPNVQSVRYHGLWDNFVFRLFRSFETANNGMKIWTDYWNALDPQDRENSFRIDLPLNQFVALDGAEKMSEIRLEAYKFLSKYDFQSIRLACLAAFFFFELEGMPVLNGRLYECHGAIYCRSIDRAAVVSKLLEDFPEACFMASTTSSSNSSSSSSSHLGSVVGGTICSSCGAYRNKVSVFLHRLDQATSIFIRFNKFHLRLISGFPNLMTWFVERQQIESAFGFVDHRPFHNNAQGFSCCSYGQKRKRKTTTKPRKRRCK